MNIPGEFEERLHRTWLTVLLEFGHREAAALVVGADLAVKMLATGKRELSEGNSCWDMIGGCVRGKDGSGKVGTSWGRF